MPASPVRLARLQVRFKTQRVLALPIGEQAFPRCVSPNPNQGLDIRRLSLIVSPQQRTTTAEPVSTSPQAKRVARRSSSPQLGQANEMTRKANKLKVQQRKSTSAIGNIHSSPSSHIGPVAQAERVSVALHKKVVRQKVLHEFQKVRHKLNPFQRADLVSLADKKRVWKGKNGVFRPQLLGQWFDQMKDNDSS